MNQSLIERGLMLLGALLLGLFVLGFSVPALGAWQSEIRLLMVVGVVLYAAYSFWTQSNDAKDLAAKASEATKWRLEAEHLRSNLNQLQSELQEASEALKKAEAANKKLEIELEQIRTAMQVGEKSRELSKPHD